MPDVPQAPRTTETTAKLPPKASPLVTAACLVVLVWAASAAEAFIVPLLLAAMLAFSASPLVRLLRRKHAPEWLAVTLSAAALAAPVLLVALSLAHQFESFTNELPKITQFVDGTIATAARSKFAHHLGIVEPMTVAKLLGQANAKAGDGVHLAISAVQTVVATTTEAVLVFFFAIFMLASRQHLYRSAVRILARWEGVEAARMLDATTTLVEQFLITKLAVSFIVGLVSSLALWAIGIPYSYLLGATVGILTMIPEAGFVVSLIPIILVALTTGAGLPITGAAVAAMIVVHLIEANVLTPKMVGGRLNLNALATFVALFAGGLLWNVWGMFLSIPILGVLRIVFSVSPSLEPWGALLAEREDHDLRAKLVRDRVRGSFTRVKPPRQTPART